MSNFLNELNKNAKTKEEYLIQEKYNESQKKKEYEEKLLQKQIEEKKEYDRFIADFAVDIKSLCVEAVKEACYINLDGNRYILCEIAFMHTYKYDIDGYGYGSGHHYYTLFRCCKLEHDSIFQAKRTYISKSIQRNFAAPGCESIGRSDHRKTPNYLNLSDLMKKNIDGYTDINDLPKKIVEKNYANDSNSNYGPSFTEAMESLRFAIKF